MTDRPFQVEVSHVKEKKILHPVNLPIFSTQPNNVSVIKSKK